MMRDPQETSVAKPPRPTKTLADIRRRSELRWRASLILIWEWMEATIPETVCGLAGEGKLEAVEQLYDQGYQALTDRTSDMLQEDYALTVIKDAAGNVVAEPIPYKDAYGRHRDFHALRHTGYTWVEAQGVSRHIIARIFGHRTEAMGDIYSHPDWQAMQAAILKLPEVAAGDVQVKTA